MTHLTRLSLVRDDIAYHYPSDVERIVEAMAAEGFEITANDAHDAWEMYSESMCAGWMSLPRTTDAIVMCIRGYFREA